MFQIGLKEQKQVISLACGKKSQKLACIKALFLVFYFFNISINDLVLFIATTTLLNNARDSTMNSSDKTLIL